MQGYEEELMSLYSLIRESVPRIRETDLLSLDHPHRPYPAEHRVRFSGWVRALVFVAVLVGTLIIYSSVYAAVTGSFQMDNVWATLSSLVASVVAYAVLTMVTEARIWPFEFSPPRALGLLKGMLLSFIMISVCIGILAIAGCYTITGFNPNYSVWLDLLSLGVVAAVSEEIMFRGALFRLTEEGIGSWGASAISALVFGFLHLRNPLGTIWGSVAIAIEAGILLAAVYVITRSLWWCIGVHFAWNMTMGPIYGSVVSGSGTQNSWLTSHWSGPDILTGGSFGLEASIIPVSLLGVMGIAALIYAQRKGLMIRPIWARKQALEEVPDSAMSDEA